MRLKEINRTEIEDHRLDSPGGKGMRKVTVFVVLFRWHRSKAAAPKKQAAVSAATQECLSCHREYPRVWSRTGKTAATPA